MALQLLNSQTPLCTAIDPLWRLFVWQRKYLKSVHPLHSNQVSLLQFPMQARVPSFVAPFASFLSHSLSVLFVMLFRCFLSPHSFYGPGLKSAPNQRCICPNFSLLFLRRNGGCIHDHLRESSQSKQTDLLQKSNTIAVQKIIFPLLLLGL